MVRWVGSPVPRFQVNLFAGSFKGSQISLIDATYQRKFCMPLRWRFASVLVAYHTITSSVSFCQIKQKLSKEKVNILDTDSHHIFRSICILPWTYLAYLSFLVLHLESERKSAVLHSGIFWRGPSLLVRRRAQYTPTIRWRRLARNLVTTGSNLAS